MCRGYEITRQAQLQPREVTSSTETEPLQQIRSKGITILNSYRPIAQFVTGSSNQVSKWLAVFQCKSKRDVQNSSIFQMDSHKTHKIRQLQNKPESLLTHQTTTVRIFNLKFK
jgi:hypothetical protein